MDKKINDFSWKVAGAAGDGILSAGMLFAKTCMRGGLHVFATAEYPSLIRGGHNHLDVRVSAEPVHTHSKNIDMLIALNQDAIDYHIKKISPGGALVYDSSETDAGMSGRKDIHLYSIPLKKIAEEHGGPIMKNTVAMGATIGLLEFDLALFDAIITERFGKKAADVIAENIKAAKAGYDFANSNFKDYIYKLEKKSRKNTLMMTGNEAISAGAIKAGCKFYSAYPMTPASSILSYMAAAEKQFGMVVKHTEDEISAINMAIGASYAGARSMTGTSGGGFSLMVEGLGLAAMTETPIVIVEAQRPGPASGMATHSGQGDLEFMLHASPDEFPRIVVAPGDVSECFFQTIKAFNMAEKYQIPVLILTDKFLGESYWSTEAFDESEVKSERGLLLKESDLAQEKDYKRYKITPNGVSPRSRPGFKNGIFIASSYEHDERGTEREEEAIRVAMHNKRFRKLDFMAKDLEPPKLEGDSDADVTIVSWGSSKGPVKEAMEIMKKDGIKANFLQLLYLSPFPSEDVKAILGKSKIIVDVECNKTGQLASVIRENTGIEVNHKVLRYDGRAIWPEDLASAVRKIVQKNAPKVIDINDCEGDEQKDLDDVKIRTFKLSESSNKMR